MFSSLFASPIKQLTLSVMITVLSTISVANDLPKETPEDVGVSSERLKNLSSAMQRYIDANLLAGTVSLVSRNGKIIHFDSQGWKDKESDEAMTDDTIFFIMSMTKPIVSAALMMLYEQGHFLLTDPIADWIPELQGKEVIVNDEFGTHRVPSDRPINFRHVLSHTSGLDPSRDELTQE